MIAQYFSNNKKNRYFVLFFTGIFMLLVPFICHAADTLIYDDLNRLERAIYDNGAIIIYSYDEVGNRITKEINNICEGDLNSDGAVDLFDFGLFKAEYGRVDCSEENPCAGDLDGDGSVNLLDFGIFRSDYGRTDCPMI